MPRKSALYLEQDIFSANVVPLSHSFWERKTSIFFGSVAISMGTGCFWKSKDLSELCAELKAKGIEFTVPEKEVRPGVRIAMVKDPDCNIVEVVEWS